MTEQQPYTDPAASSAPPPPPPPSVSAPASAEVSSSAESDTSSTPAPAVPVSSSTPPESNDGSQSEAKAQQPPSAGVGDLVTYVHTDAGGYEHVRHGLVLDLLDLPDEDGNEVSCARVVELPEPRLLPAAGLERL